MLYDISTIKWWRDALKLCGYPATFKLWLTSIPSPPFTNEPRLPNDDLLIKSFSHVQEYSQTFMKKNGIERSDYFVVKQLWNHECLVHKTHFYECMCGFKDFFSPQMNLSANFLFQKLFGVCSYQLIVHSILSFLLHLFISVRIHTCLFYSMGYI